MKSLAIKSLLLCSTLALVACDDDDNNTSSVDRSTSAESTTYLRALHLSPDAPLVDVAVDGAVVLEDVSYRAASGFLELSSGVVDIDIRVANTATSALSAMLMLNEDTKYTVVAVDQVAQIAPLVIEDNDSPSAGFAQLTVVHGAPQAPDVDVYVSAPDAVFASLSPLLEDVSFKDISAELEVPAGEYRVRVTLADATDVIYDSGTLNLGDGIEYVALASQVEAGLSPIGLTILTDVDALPVVAADDARGRVRVVHASADAPQVDVSVDGATVLSDVAFTGASDYLTLLGDTYNIDVAASSSGTSVINADLTFTPQSDYTVIALNNLDNIEALVLEDDNSAPVSGNIKVRLVHGAASAAVVDIYVTSPGADISGVDPTISGFMFKDDSGYLEVPEGSYQVRVTLPGTKNVVLDTGAIVFSDGVVRTAIALDPVPGSSDFGVLLLEDN